MARKFLYLIATIIVLVIAALFALRIWADELSEIAFVPTGDFAGQEALARSAYADPQMWFARPGKPGDNPVQWQPAPAAPATGSEAGDAPAYAVFFIHPTSYLDRSQWNAPLADSVSQTRARLFLKGMASPFGTAREIWAPRYRQATFGSFLVDARDADKADAALDLAYRDVEQAFDYFVAAADPKLPIVLAGHSQGSLHLLRLLKERIAGTPLQARIAMAYAIGWPVSLDHDLPSLGLPACTAPEQGACIVSWLSFADPADPGQMLKRYTISPGFDGKKRGGSPVLCSNPITGMQGGEAPASDNLGSLVPAADLRSGRLVPGGVPARCDASGLLLIGDPPKMGPAVLPGNNYHVYDIPLFWQNLQADVARRVGAWQRPR